MEKNKERKGAAQNAPQSDRKSQAVKPGQRRRGAENGKEKRSERRLSYETELRYVLEPYMDAIHRLYDCSCREKVFLNLDVNERRGDDGVLTVRASLLVSRIDADSKEFRDGKVTDRKWHSVFRKERRLTEGETLDVRDFCTSFIEWCTFLFTDRKALVRALNVGKRKKFLWFRL